MKVFFTTSNWINRGLIIFNNQVISHPENPEVFGGEKSGLLVVQDFEDEDRGTDLEDQDGPIRIVEASKLEDSIEDLISKVF